MPWISTYIQYEVWYEIIYQPLIFSGWSLGKDKYFHHTLNWVSDYLSMMSIHISNGAPLAGRKFLWGLLWSKEISITICMGLWKHRGKAIAIQSPHKPIQNTEIRLQDFEYFCSWTPEKNSNCVLFPFLAWDVPGKTIMTSPNPILGIPTLIW